MNRTLALSALAAALSLASCGGSGESGTGGSASTASTGGSTGTSTSTQGGGGNGGDGGTTTTTTAGGGGAGGTTTTTMSECNPGTMEACYTGPAGSENLGICKAGTHTCKADGTWGLCIGQVTPLPETCETPVDDDCDGAVNESGMGCECVPGGVDDCYSGPPATEGMGVCKAGNKVCNDDGLGYGPCKGEILPSPENCLAPTDEDCDGNAAACTGSDLWHKRFGDAGAQSATGVADRTDGGAVIVGTFAGIVDFGGGALTSGGGNDAFVASYDYLGAHQWSKRFGDAAAQSATAVSVDGLGNVFVTGDNGGKIDPGGGVLTSAGLADVYLVKYNGAGAFQWAKEFGNASAQNALACAADAQGRVAIAGTFAGSIDFGGGLLTSAGTTDAFVAVFDQDGTHLWSKRFGDAAAQSAKAVAFGPMGEVVVAGDFAGAIDLGAGAMTSAGGTDVFLAQFDKNGALIWSKQFGNAVAQLANAVTIDSVGNVVLAVSFAGNVDFGGGVLTSAGGNDIGLARFATGGMLLWGKRFGAAGADNARGVAVDPFGAVELAGDFSGSVDFGGGALVSAGGTDVVVARFDALGAHVWSHRAGDAGAQVASGVAANDKGVFVTGTFAGNVDFGGGAMTSAGGNDVFLVKLSP